MFPTQFWLTLLLSAAAALAVDAPASEAFKWMAASTWDGNDGSWSTFAIRIDSEPNSQYFRVLPATDLSEIWVVDSKACKPENDTVCVSQRGGTFNMSKSTSWEEEGLYVLDGAKEFFNYSDPKLETKYDLPPPGNYGLATVGLTRYGSGISLNQQVVASFRASNFYLGFFGLAIQNTEFTMDSHTSFVTTLFNESLIPSLSWGYQVGAAYRNKTTSSLVLGGYDTSRFEPNNSTFKLANNPGKEIVAPLTNLSFTASSQTIPQNILTKPINVSIDSATPYIWLPVDVCKRLEAAFNLTWNKSEELYLLDEPTYRRLRAASPKFHFTLQTNASNHVDIVVPYAALDLKIALPQLKVVTNSTTWQKYLPIKRAWDESQYTLGRSFMQEA